MLYQYYVVEIKKDENGEFEHEVYWLYDTDAVKAKQKGESKYHEVMSRAAVSSYVEHSAILFSSKSDPIMFYCYHHEATTE